MTGNTDTRKIGPFDIGSLGGILQNIILEQQDYGLFCLNHCMGKLVAGPPPVTDQPANETYISICEQLNVVDGTSYPTTMQTISFTPSNSKIPINITVKAGPPWPSPPWPKNQLTASKQYSFNALNYHSWK